MLDAETERELGERGVPEGDIEELRKFADFLRKRKAYRRARDAGTLTDEMRREYIELIDSLDK